MRQSQLFTKTRKEAPSDEVAKNAQLLIRAGYIHKEMAGVYSYLPLGLRVFNKVGNIIRQEMDAIGGQELKLTALQDGELWAKTGRFNDAEVNNWFKTKLKNGKEVGLAFTHEEPLTNLMRDHVRSHKDLPILAYQIQTKFRNEKRSKSGLMRGREFSMKDMYSFARTNEEHKELYAKVRDAYVKIFERVGLGDLTKVTFASGGVFSKYSEEFQTISKAGEDIIYLDEKKNIAVNKEVNTEEVLKDLELEKDNLVEHKSIETGNIFSLGTKFSEPLGLTFKDEKENDVPVIMGSYGIGVGRLMGTLVEVLADNKGIVWTEETAPFKLHLIVVGDDEEVYKHAVKLYDKLVGQGKEVLLDDRNIRPGVKFADSDLIGIPKRVVVSEKTIAEGRVEVTVRASGETTMVDEVEFLNSQHV